MCKRGEEEYVDMLTYYLRRFGKICLSQTAKLCPILVELEIVSGEVTIDNEGVHFIESKRVYKCPACGNELTPFQLPAHYINGGIGFCPYCDQTLINTITSTSLFKKEKDKMYSEFFKNWCRNYNKDTWYI